MKKLRNLINDKSKPLVVPGVYDAIGAKIAQKVGFDAMFQTGYGTSATLLGMPDYGFIGSSETTDNARRIANVISVPLNLFFYIMLSIVIDVRRFSLNIMFIYIYIYIYIYVYMEIQSG